jgi:hypothetical protein
MLIIRDSFDYQFTITTSRLVNNSPPSNSWELDQVILRR